MIAQLDPATTQAAAATATLFLVLAGVGIVVVRKDERNERTAKQVDRLIELAERHDVRYAQHERRLDDLERGAAERIREWSAWRMGTTEWRDQMESWTEGVSHQLHEIKRVLRAVSRFVATGEKTYIEPIEEPKQ